MLGSEVQAAEKPFIVAGIDVGIRGQDRGQPVLHVQLERGGDLSHMDAERPLQLPECAPEDPAMKAPAVGVVVAFASVGPHPLKELPAGRPHRPQTCGQLRVFAVQFAQLIAETMPDFDH